MNNNADNKPGVMIYFDIIPLIEGMSPDDAGQLFLAILKYAQYGEIPSLSGFALAVWPFVKSLVDRDSQRYDLVRKKKQWAVYCREAKRRGETPLELEAWIIESERSPAINTDNHSSSPIIDDDVCYPTTTPAPTTATTPTTTTSPISSTADRGLGGTRRTWQTIPLLRPIARRLLLEAIMLCRQKINGNICVRVHRTCWQVIRDRRRARSCKTTHDYQPRQMRRTNHVF